LLVTNYEGVVNGDYFQENPVLRIDDLRDVDAPNTGAHAVQDGQILVWNATTQRWENRDNTLTVYEQSITGNNGNTTNNLVITLGPRELTAETNIPNNGSMFVCDFDFSGSFYYRAQSDGVGTTPVREGWTHGTMAGIAFRLSGSGTDTGTFTEWTTTNSLVGAGHDMHLDTSGMWGNSSSVVFSINQSTREITCTVTMEVGSRPRSIGNYSLTARMTNVRVMPLPTATA
jgi:hypothetical protein